MASMYPEIPGFGQLHSGAITSQKDREAADQFFKRWQAHVIGHPEHTPFGYVKRGGVAGLRVVSKGSEKSIARAGGVRDIQGARIDASHQRKVAKASRSVGPPTAPRTANAPIALRRQAPRAA